MDRDNHETDNVGFVYFYGRHEISHPYGYGPWYKCQIYNFTIIPEMSNVSTYQHEKSQVRHFELNDPLTKF